MADTPLEDYSISSESGNWSSGEEPWDSDEEDEAPPRASPGGWNIVAPNRFRPTVHAAFNSPLTVEDRRNRLSEVRVHEYSFAAQATDMTLGITTKRRFNR